ncbi:hypothetical protein ER308_07280 [Egibacter rhizosphaerae]|uniref:Uncharacterized protein n=1 Tax=Egibacter rhizosphaerae TaxID=1670831 RepID=A0A411YE06_9ACTN|nr:hypothetical protein [Egibacter rhizosphaerae]QBI19367.1 hypothetical protein ER308_07280 [Egibacter rhizosphaerae]
MRILAIDASLRSTGWAVAPAHHGLVKPPSDYRGAQRLNFIVRELARVAAPHDDSATSLQLDVAVIEGAAYLRTNRAYELGELSGVVKLWLHSHGVPYVVVQPKRLKKYATGNGNADKAAMVSAARDRLGYGGRSDDEADALWLWHLAGEAFGLVASPHGERSRVVDEVDWPRLASRVTG